MPKPILIDTHAHVNFKDFKDDGEQVVRRALGRGVWMINVGAQYSTSKRAVEYAKKYKEGVYAAVGLHPSHILEGKKVPTQGRNPERSREEREYEELDEKKYMKLLENEKVVAVGEIGLEYGENITDEKKEKQKEVLFRQLEMAQQMGKPVIFHCRKAYDDLIELLDMFNLGCASCPHACPSVVGEETPQLKGVVHCFMGRLSQAKKIIEMGLTLSFNGLVTYARDYDKVIKEIPLDKILLETDCPYLSPEPDRDKRNEPINVKRVAEKIAEIKGIKFEEVAKQTTKNAKELFNI